MADLQGKGGRTSRATLTFHWSHAAVGASIVMQMCPCGFACTYRGHAFVCARASLPYLGSGVNLHACRSVRTYLSAPTGLCTCKPACTLGCQHVLVHVCVLRYMNARGCPGMLARCKPRKHLGVLQRSVHLSLWTCKHAGVP